MTTPPIAIAVHGGAGVIQRELLSAEVERHRRQDLEAALTAGHAVLALGGSSLDAVVAVVEVLEDLPAFNDGKGGVLTRDGKVVMEASIM
jgi:beta-aspartyl-peptidase (threonine type)